MLHRVDKLKMERSAVSERIVALTMRNERLEKSDRSILALSNVFMDSADVVPHRAENYKTSLGEHFRLFRPCRLT
jgi:hypothetical protein